MASPRRAAGAVPAPAPAPRDGGAAAGRDTAGSSAGVDAGGASGRPALQELDANIAANSRVRTPKPGQPRLLNSVASSHACRPKVRGPGKPKTEAATPEQATGSLSAGLVKLNNACVEFSRKGTVAGDAGKQHHVAAITVACIQGRIPHEGKNQGGRVSREKKRKATEDAAELFVLACDAGQHRSNSELAGFLRAAAAALDANGIDSGGETGPGREGAPRVNLVARKDGCPDVSAVDFVKKVHGSVQGATVQDRMAAVSHTEISADLRDANPVRFGFPAY